MDKSDKIFVAGHRGMVGSAVLRRLEAEGFGNIVRRARAQLDLTDQSAVVKFFAKEKPDIVVVAAAKVGGIKANNEHPVEFLLENLRIQRNITCVGCTPAQSARSKIAERSKTDRLGHRQTAPRIFARGRLFLGMPFTAGEI